MKKVVLSLLAGVMLSSAAVAEEGGFFSKLGDALTHKIVKQKVDGLLAANLHSTCPYSKEEVGGKWLYIPCAKNASLKEADVWIYNVNVFEKRGKPTRTSDYLTYREDSEDYKLGYDHEFSSDSNKTQERFVYYYDSADKTEVFVFGHCYNNKCALLDDFIVSSTNFELKHDRAF